MVLPNLAFKPQDSNNSIAGFASSGKNLRAVQTIATVSPSFKNGGIIIQN
jgi:hypothetical protein